MKTNPLLIGVSLLSVAIAGCSSPMTEKQRLIRERDANSKTTEKYGNLTVENERKTETFGRETTTSASSTQTIRVP